MSAVSCLIIGLAIAPPAAAHWGDLATAEIVVEEMATRITLTYPTGLTAFADDDGSGQLSNAELTRHRDELTRRLEPAIALTDSRHQAPRQAPQLTLQSVVDSTSPEARIAPSSHTTLQLRYGWAEPPAALAIAYTFFPSDAPGASCLATIAQNGRVTNHVFTPQAPTFTLPSDGAAPRGMGAWALPLMGAFMWGAVHSLSPGHGKTLVGAYLVGERATSRHALFLALMTTLTHTVGVFALGLVTLAAARYVLPEQIYPWLSLISGGLIVYIGSSLIAQRSQRRRSTPAPHGHPHPHDHGHPHGQDPDHRHPHLHPQDHSHPHAQDHSHPHAQDHDHGHPHPHDHDHTHDHHHGHQGHSHLPVIADNTPTWRSLLLLGLSAGLVPCPAALVLLLGAIALGNPISGLLLVVAFSLGLASVLTGLGLLLVSAKQLFKQVPAPRLQASQWLPLASAVGITVIGVGISTRSILQML